MTGAAITDAAIAALVDGELPQERAAEIEAAAAHDPALAARIGRARALRNAISQAYAETLEEPSPARLLAAIEGAGSVVELAAWRFPRRPPAWMVGTAIAAALVLAFGLGLNAPRGPISTTDARGLVAQGPLAEGLEHDLASKPTPGAPVTIGLSFAADDGRYCRTFVLRQAKPIAGLACRSDDGWRIEVAAAAPPPLKGAYETAASETPAPVLDAVDRMIKGEPLDATGEAKAAKAGWKGSGH